LLSYYRLTRYVDAAMRHAPCAMRRARSPRGGHRVVWRDLVSIPLVGAYAAFFAGQIVMGILSGLWAIWLSDLGGSTRKHISLAR